MASEMNGELSDKEKEALLEETIGYKFQDGALRTRAITRRAWVEDHKPAKEKEQEALATLGDALIGEPEVLCGFLEWRIDDGILDNNVLHDLAPPPPRGKGYPWKKMEVDLEPPRIVIIILAHYFSKMDPTPLFEVGPVQSEIPAKMR